MKKIIISILFLFPVGVFAAMPVFPMSFYGGITINNVNAPIGTIVRAYYDTTLAGQIAVNEAGIYGYNLPTKQQLLVGEGRGTIHFTVQSNVINDGKETEGAIAQIHTAFISGGVVKKDFAFSFVVPPSPPATPTGNGGGGGGGGTPAVILKKILGDINEDGKINKYDFALLMSNWGKTASNLSDLNGDGKVNKYDFALLMANWTK